MKWFLLSVFISSTTAVASAQAQSRSFSVSVRTGGSILLTPTRTQGGGGGGLGVRVQLDPHWLLQADAAILVGLGMAGVIRAGAGWQHAGGTWAPLIRADAELGVGQRLDFSSELHLPPRGPSLGAVLSVGLLRFAVAGAIVSALELGGGVGTDFLTIGPRISVTLLEISLPL